MLPNQRTDVLFVLMTVLACVMPGSVLAQTESDDLNTSELNVDAVEPQISLPEIRKGNPASLRVQTISLGQRKESRDGLVRLSQEAVDTTARRLLSSDQHTPWQMMHALLGLRQEFDILHQKQEVSGLEWMAQGQVFNGDHWFEKTQHGGRAHPYSVPYAFEGHANQMLAVLSMCGLETDHEFQTADGTITIADMIEHAKMTCDTKKDEPTWTLWALSRYLAPDAVWRNENGEVCSIELLVADQTKRSLKGAACGGTHGLFALAHARNVYLREGKPLRGVWLQSENKLRYYINTARRLQNPNGSLSSNYLRSRTYNPDFNKRMASAGHVLEFLMLALPQNELNQRWVRRAIETTARDLLNNRKQYVKCSPLYHSVNALNIYLDRVNPREEIPQTAQVQPPRTAMVNPEDGRREVPTRGISRSRVLDDQKVSGDEKAAPVAEVAATPAISEVMETPEDALPAEASENEQEVHAPLPTTSSAEEAASKKHVPEQNGTSQLPLTGPTGGKLKYQIDRSVADAIVQRRLDELEAAAEGYWKATDQNRSDTDEAAAAEAEGSEVSTDADDLIRLKPVESKSTLQKVIVPEAAIEESQPEPSHPVVAPKRAPLVVENRSDFDHFDSGDHGNSATQLAEINQQEEPLLADRPMLRSRLHTGDERSNPFSVERPFSRAPLSIPTTAVSESRTVAREEAAIDVRSSENAGSGVEDTKPANSTDQHSDDQATQERKATEFSTIPAGINDRFLDPDMNPEEWVNRFEVESREIYARRNEIVKAIGLSAGEAIADVGAGTGLFTELFSKAVGTTGKVYAIDISPRLVTHLEKRVTTEGLSNVMVVRNDAMSIQLVTRKVDKAFVCDTYHHFERPDAMLKSIHRSLNEGGELVVIDFERIPGESRDWVIGHVRAGKETFRSEIEVSGFDFVKEVKVEGFKENYLLIFRKQ